MYRLGFLVAFSWLAPACSGDGATPRFATTAEAATEETFYDVPFPNDLRRRADGTLDLAAFPSNALLLDQVRAAAEHYDGFSTNAAIFVKFDGQLDPASLPDPAK